MASPLDRAFTIVAVSIMFSTEWAGQGYFGQYNQSSGTVTMSTPGCSGVFALDSASASGGLSLQFPGAPAPRPGSAIVSFVGSFPTAGGSASSCSSVCVSEGVSLAWDAIGHVVGSSRYTGAPCPSYFGVSLEGSGIPPYGSGVIYYVDSSNGTGLALYGPAYFAVLTSEGCGFLFSRPAVNHRSDGYMSKFVLDGQPMGGSCPVPGDGGCSLGYWLVSNAVTGVLGFVDTGRGPCPAFFAQAKEGSTPASGTFDMTLRAEQGPVLTAVSGTSGVYSAATASLVLTFPGCSATYKVDPATIGSSGSMDSCPSPPSERCCTRVIERRGAQLRVHFGSGEARAISSITLWDTTAVALGATPAHLASVGISVGSDKSMTGCFISGQPASPPPSGFEGRDIVCGSAGEMAMLSFPDMLMGGQGKLAVKLCTVPAAMGGRATLLVKTSS